MEMLAQKNGRGTKTITDIITDLLHDVIDYQRGKAHVGITVSGAHIAKKHEGLSISQGC
jgi:hypothetical protein